MSRLYRIILLTLSSIILISLGFILEGNLKTLLENFWFTAGLLLLILLSLVDQPFFSKDSNVFVNAITAGISLLIVPEEKRDELFYVFLFIVLYLSISSYILMIVRKNPLKEENKAVQFFSRLNRTLGKPEMIFSAFFLWGAISQYLTNISKLNPLLLFWVIFMLLNIPELTKIIEKLFERKKKPIVKGIGTIMGIHSTNIFLVKLEKEYKNNSLFKFVEFKCSSDGEFKRGLIFETMLLDQEQWIKVITNTEFASLCCDVPQIENPVDDIIYLLENIPDDSLVSKFIGLVTEGSVIGKIKFLYASKVPISEGSMLEVNFNNRKVLYQIIEGKTHTETLNNNNEMGYIIGEAVQIGTWNDTLFRFEKYGWVPSMNYPVFLASDINKIDPQEDEIVLGYLPGTNYPVILEKKVAITHHLAIIGVTGTGKSVFSRNIIKEYLKDDSIKVICVDFTGEYKEKFFDLNPKAIIDDETSKKLFKYIDSIEQEMAINYNKDNEKTRSMKIEIYNCVINAVDEFIKSDQKISIFELPEVENSSGVMKYTQTFFKALFKIAKEKGNHGKTICLVLEEAHTIIPESNFAGISDKISQPLINSIAQIALQGRKYNIGLLVIAQRTANVSKTILTQCNSIISFQEYDKTSIDFLSNYFGQEISGALNELKFRQAVAAGKAFKSNVPMIFEVSEIIE